MEKEKIVFISIILILLLGVLGVIVYYQMNLPKDDLIDNNVNDQLLIDDEIDDELINGDDIACAMDVMECPDGSFVGRIPPTCDFVECLVTDDYSEEINDPISLIDNYDSCVGAGFPILESFPEQCLTPDGRMFTNE